MKEKAALAFAQAKKFWTALTLAKKIGLVATMVLSVALVLGVSAASSHETYALLFTDLSAEDASLVTAKLKELKVPYKVEGESGILVPEERVRELRLDLAGQGLPRGGGVGFEVFDKQHLGATELEQRVLVRRALEGELSRTISGIQSVQSARVHLVMPERSLFVTQQRDAATASVVVKLRPGRSIGNGDVASIVHLVASAVPGLSESRVSVVSADGTTLHRPNGDGESASGEARGERERELSSSLEARARELLERTVGRGHADVRVSVDLDSSSHERMEEHYEPQKSVLRSEQHTEERSGPGTTSVAGVPTAPPGPSAAAAASATPQLSASAALASASAAAAAAASAKQAQGVPGSQTTLPGGSGGVEGQTSVVNGPFRESYTKNFEVDRVTEKTVQTSGKVMRMSVAVLVDGVKKDGVVAPREKEEVARLGELVKTAVGFNADRGDALHIESSAFSASELEEPVALPVAPLATKMAKAKTYAPIAAALVALMAVGIFSLRRKRARAKKASASNASEPPIFQLENSATTVKELTAGDVELMRKEAVDLATRDPATAANVLRAWLSSPSAT